MRKIVLIFIMIIVATIFAWIVYDGIKVGDFEVFSYTGIDKKSKDLDNLIVEYDSKNPGELKRKQSEIVKKIEEYEAAKNQYDQLLNEKKNDLMIMETANCYDVDYLWTKTGNYATEHGIDLEMDVTKSSSDQNKNEYILADLNFTIMGDYEDIAFFINDIEKDEKLEFEIRDFNMKKEIIKKNENDLKGTSVLKATFKVYGVAINKATLTNLTQANQTPNDKLENIPNVSDSTGANF